MTSSSAEALFEVSSGNFRALRIVYDEHAAAVWGLALVVTRSRRRAARVLATLLTDLSQSPERFADGRDLRVSILAAAFKLASQEARRKRWPWSRPVRRSLALERPVEAALAARLDSAGDDEALRIVLEAAEGLTPDHVAAGASLAVPPGKPAARWQKPPRSLKALLLMKSTEAARPERKYVRWFLLWLAPLAGLVLARLSERTAPKLPVERYWPPLVNNSWSDEATREDRAKLLRFLRRPEDKK
jgi:hypothetical protein